MRKYLLVLMVLALAWQFNGIGAAAITADARQKIDISGHPVKGPGNAGVTVIVFSDYLCPACRRLEPILHQVLEKYPKDVRLVHKLCTHHDFSRKAVAAAYAALDQNRFWEFHDRLFEYQLGMNKAMVISIAKELHLDLKRFNKKMKDPAIQKLIDRDMEDVSRLSIPGTPTVYVNGIVLEDRSLQGFQAAIERELNRK